MVPLVGENRILASAGLNRLNNKPRAGLESLINVSAIHSKVGVHEVGFQLAPRLNATGRLETAEDALQLLLAESVDESLPLAQKLDAKNRERQMIEHRIFEDVYKIVLDKFNPDEDYVIVEGNPKWHIGVVGIVASKILQQFYRPTIIMGGDRDHFRGSCRSIDGFDIAKALCKCRDLLIKCGGHSMAAGVTLKHSNLNRLRERLNEFAKQELKKEDLYPV
jgi:single-stranded-DNA-specific exonuclease